jgi:hypothetical protein
MCAKGSHIEHNGTKVTNEASGSWFEILKILLLKTLRQLIGRDFQVKRRILDKRHRNWVNKDRGTR